MNESVEQVKENSMAQETQPEDLQFEEMQLEDLQFLIRKENDQIRIQAYHSAGHAIAAFLSGGQLVTVRLNGEDWWEEWHEHFQQANYDQQRQFTRVNVETAFTALGGIAGVAHATGGWHGGDISSAAFSPHDYTRCRQLLADDYKEIIIGEIGINKFFEGTYKHDINKEATYIGHMIGHMEYRLETTFRKTYVIQALEALASVLMEDIQMPGREANIIIRDAFAIAYKERMAVYSVQWTNKQIRVSKSRDGLDNNLLTERTFVSKTCQK